ncbi:MAG TPA: type 4a pilus biogenesis protein PilO, partial [Candidatus Limnocylindria bacterium]|nr:type 4a pilus biogenesis protein PilO [Candidatus Limnocylindria bacterium]
YAPTRSLQKLSGTVYVIGTFSQLEAFLRKLENSGRIIDVSDLAIDPGTDGNLNLRVSIASYYFAP